MGLLIMQGILAGLTLAVGALLINLVPRYRWLVASALLVLVTPLALGGFWFSSGELGISDWDYYFSYHEVVRRMVLNGEVPPTWNPYICGGTSAIGDPEFPLFTPTFLLELAFGIPIGLRLAIFTATAIGALGVLMLGKRLRLSVTAALIAAVGFSFSSLNILEIVEGHPNIFAAMYLPWILWSWLGAYQAAPTANLRLFEHRKLHIQNVPSLVTRPWFLWSMACGLFLALTFLQGGIYLLMYTALVFAAIIICVKRRRDAFVITIVAAVWALGLAALKLVPVLLWLRQFQDEAYASSAYLLPYLHHILLGRYLHGSEDVIPNQGSGWHEYGAYVGPFILGLAAISLLTITKRRTVRLLILGALAATIIASSGPLLRPLFDQAPFLPRSNISRFMIYAVIPISLLAGFGFDRLTSWISAAVRKLFDSSRPGRQRLLMYVHALIAAIIVGAVAIDLMTLSYPLSQQAFVLDPVVPTVSPAPSPLAYTIDQHLVRHEGVDYTRAYASIIADFGTMSYCSVLSPSPAVRVIEDPEGSPYVTVTDPNGSASLISWTPSRITVAVTATAPADVVINSNYAQGWQANGQPAHDIAGRLAVAVPPGQHTIIFAYRAPGLAVGLLISTVTALTALVILWHARQRAPIASQQ